MTVQRRRSDGAPKRNPIRDAIATWAYEQFIERGGEHGHDLDDWLAAEREFVTRQARSHDPTAAAPELLTTRDSRATSSAPQALG
jgi:hypothetical protein